MKATIRLQIVPRKGISVLIGGGYMRTDMWKQKNGGTDLGYGSDGTIVVWEYLPQNNKGGIICIGSVCYDWYPFGIDVSTDKYHKNMFQITENVINYLISK